MWPGFTCFLADDVLLKDKLSYLNIIHHNENLEFQTEDDKNMVSEKILDWVSSPLTRYEGLMLWNIALEKCDLYLSNWGKLLYACLELSASCSNRKVALKILDLMVIKFGSKSDFHPAFRRDIPNLITCLLQDLKDTEGLVSTCKSLALCMQELSDMLGSHTAVIEGFLVKHLDNESTEVVEALSECFALFPNCILHYLKPRCSYSEGWSELYSKAVNTLCLLFEDVIHFNTGANGPRPENNRSPVLPIACNLEGGLPYLCYKVRVFSALSRYLAKLMSSVSPRVKIHLVEVLELIKRVMTFPEETAVNAMDESLIHLIFPQFSQTAFMLLEAIVLNFSDVEHTENILEVALKATSSPVHRSKEVQLSAWKFLNVWMKQSGCTVSNKIVSNKLVGELLSDIVISREGNTDSELKKETCAEALKVLNMLIESACSFFEQKNMEFLISTILQIVREVQCNSHPFKSLPYPYMDDNCRLELYRLLLTCCVNDHPCKKNCIAKSVIFFKYALKDPSIEVTNVCQQACNLFVYFNNPKKPPPDYTLPIIVDTPRVDELDEDIIDEWEATDEEQQNYEEDNWQPNGLAAPANNLPAAGVNRADDVFQEAAMDNENSRGRLAEQDSPRHYVELLPSNHYNNSRTMSRDSSLSEDLDEESESDEEEVVNEDSRNSIKNRSSNTVPTKLKRAPTDIPSAQSTHRPNIQVLEARSTALARTDEDSSDANMAVVRDVQSEQNSMEEDGTPVTSPKRVVSENGAVEECEEEEEEACEEEEEDENYDDGDDDEVYGEEHDEIVGGFSNEERFSSKPEARFSPEREKRLSPEPEERPMKKQRLEEVDERSSGGESNHRSADYEEMGNSEECKENNINPEVNGQQDENASSLQKEKEPTVEEMMEDFVLEEAEPS